MTKFLPKSAYSKTVRRLLVLNLCFACNVFGQTTSNTGSYAEAEACVRAKNWDEGIALLETLLGSDPRNLKALNLLGIALTGKGDLTKANQQFKLALQMNPRFLPSLKNLAINEFAQENLSAADRHLKEASRLAPQDLVVRAYLGEVSYALHNYREAVNNLSRAGNLLGEDRNLEAHLVVSHLEIGESRQALALLDRVNPDGLRPASNLEVGLALASRAYFREAIPYWKALSDSYPNSYPSNLNLATCYLESKQFSKAIEVLRLLSERGHNTSEVKNLLGEAYEDTKQTKEAIEALREATLLAPEDENNYLDLAALCINHDAFDLGNEVIQVGLHYHPQSDRLIFERGLLHELQNQFDLAEEDFRLASQFAPEKNLSYIGLSVSYIQSGNLQDAIRLLKKRVREKPNDSMLQYLLGEALVRSGASPGNPAFEEAQTALAKSISLDARFAPAQVELAKTFLMQNRVAEAVAHLERACVLDPTDKAPYSLLAVAYRRQGKPELAQKMLTDLIELNEQERSQSSRRVRLIRDNPERDPRSEDTSAVPGHISNSPPGTAQR